MVIIVESRDYIFNVPVLTIGDASLSPHNTTIKLLTMAAFRSSSRFITSFLLN